MTDAELDDMLDIEADRRAGLHPECCYLDAIEIVDQEVASADLCPSCFEQMAELFRDWRFENSLTDAPQGPGPATFREWLVSLDGCRDY